MGGAIVVLMDGASRRLTQGLTNEAGHLVLRVPAPGTFRLRADRIGHPGILSDPISVVDTASVTLTMPAERFNLTELTVTGRTECSRRAEADRIADLWNEIHKALSANEITRSAESVELAVRRFRRMRTLSGTLKWDSTAREYRTRMSPFVGPDAASVRESGYVRERGGEYEFVGPDARLLLSDDFLEDHCFELVRPRKREGDAVGLGFRPVPGREVPEISGVLWVDRASAELRSAEFEYLNVPRPVRVPGLGGRVEFARLPDGAWIVHDWYIRTPVRGSFEGRPTRNGPPVLRDTVLGFLDEGGIVRPAGDRSVGVAEAAPNVRRTVDILISVRGRIVSSDGHPIRGALVAIAELDSVITTDANGAFALDTLRAGKLSLRIRAIGYRPAGFGLMLTNERRQLDTTFALAAAAQQLDSIVVTARNAPFRAGKLEDFERRRAMGFGKFLTRAELHDPVRGGLDQQLRRFARINVAPLPWACGGGYAAAARDRLGGPVAARCGHLVLDVCFMAVYLDGALFYSPDMGTAGPDLTKFNALALEAAEVYRTAAELPVEYTATGASCGVILLWTRSG